MNSQSFVLANLGCGTKCSPAAVNVDWSIYLRIKRNPLLKRLLWPFIGATRRERLASLPDNMVVHDLSKGLPFAPNSVDAVYHSHVLEHIDRRYVDQFTQRIFDVLRPGGIYRVAVPDLKKLVENYLESYERARVDDGAIGSHDNNVFEMYEQSVRKEAFGSSNRPPFSRWLENTLLGDARKRGETHQWMYDAVTLSWLLRKAGFVDVKVQSWNVSDIPNWTSIGLELDEAGGEYKPESLYVEGRKP